MPYGGTGELTAVRLIEANTPFWPEGSDYLSEYPGLTVLFGTNEFAARAFYSVTALLLVPAFIALAADCAEYASSFAPRNALENYLRW